MKPSEFLKSKIFFLLIILVCGTVVLFATDFSLMDYIAERVEKRMNLKYSPYGPQNVPDVPTSRSSQPQRSPSQEPDDPWTNNE